MNFTMGKRKTETRNAKKEFFLNTQCIDDEELKPKKKKKKAGNISSKDSNVIESITGSTLAEEMGTYQDKKSKKKRKKVKVQETHNRKSSTRKNDSLLSNEKDKLDSETVECNNLTQETIKEEMVTGNEIVENFHIVSSEIDSEEKTDTHQNKKSKKKRQKDKSLETKIGFNAATIESGNKTKDRTSKKNTILSSTQNINKSQNNMGRNKKIVFDDITGEPQETTSVVSSIDSNSRKRKQRNKEPTEQEDEFDDADIDKFCDAIDEEDNVQYENWVKLIEAKLGSEKKTK